MSKPKNENEVVKLFWTQKVERNQVEPERVLCESIYDDVLSPHTVYKFWISRKQVNWMRNMGMNPMHLHGKTYFSQGSFDDYSLWQINISGNGAGLITVTVYDQIDKQDELSLHILRRWHEQSVGMMKDALKTGELADESCDYNARCYHMLTDKMVTLGYLEPKTEQVK